MKKIVDYVATVKMKDHNGRYKTWNFPALGQGIVDIPRAKYTDHGPIFFKNGQRPAYVNSIAVGKDGAVYTLSRITGNGRTQTDLVSIPGPFSGG